MNNPIQNEAEAPDLTREIPFQPALEDETHEGANMSIKDPDSILSIVVLVLARLGLAILAHVVV